MFVVCTFDEVRNTTDEEAASTAKATKSSKTKAKSAWYPSFTSTNKPSLLELNRTVALAANALGVIVDGMEDSVRWHDIFATPSENDYDVVLQLNRKWLRPSASALKKKKKKKNHLSVAATQG